jgi:hypothetical protein
MRAFVGRWLLGILFIFASSIMPADAGTIVIDQNGAQDVSNLQSIALALHNYSDTNAHFPTESIGAGLSWRVAILPFLGFSMLFNQFDLSKPWDDPANLPLLQQMPDVYRSPFDAASSTTTRYAGGSGPGTMFDGSNIITLASVTDGTNNTLFVGETENSAIPWTKPADIPIGPNPTLGGNGFSSFIPGAVPFAFVDGNVRFLPDNIDSGTLSCLFIRNDNTLCNASPLTYVVASVPEPPSILLLLAALGFAALGAIRPRFIGSGAPRRAPAA